MTENEVWAILFEQIGVGLTERDITATVQQGYQPTQQGVQTTAQVSLSPITGRRYGSPMNQSALVGEDMKQTQGYWLERTYQVNALSIQDPTDIDAPTPFDILAAVAETLQSESTRAAMMAEGIGILRVQDMRPPFIVDDRDRNESVPNFDFTITYFNSRTTNAAPVDEILVGVHRV